MNVQRRVWLNLHREAVLRNLGQNVSAPNTRTHHRKWKSMESRSSGSTLPQIILVLASGRHCLSEQQAATTHTVWIHCVWLHTFFIYLRLQSVYMKPSYEHMMTFKLPITASVKLFSRKSMVSSHLVAIPQILGYIFVSAQQDGTSLHWPAWILIRALFLNFEYVIFINIFTLCVFSPMILMLQVKCSHRCAFIIFPLFWLASWEAIIKYSIHICT